MKEGKRTAGSPPRTRDAGQAPRARRAGPRPPAPAAGVSPPGHSEVLLASMALADAVFQRRSRRLLRVLGLCTALLVVTAVCVAGWGRPAPDGPRRPGECARGATAAGTVAS